MKREYVAIVFAGSLILAGCLPGDIRPEPGRVYVTAEASSSSVDGFTTYDGWSIHFERLLVVLGNVSVETVEGTGDCNTYENADYDRLFDFTQAGVQKLGEAYGLGECKVFFRSRSPLSDSLLQNGVTEADRDFMSEPIIAGEPMPFPADRPRLGTAIYVRGAAVRGLEMERFEWNFAMRDTLGYCGDSTTLELSSGDDLQSVITFHGEDLFRLDSWNSYSATFGGFASADIDADNEITNDELDKKIVSAPPEAGMVAHESGLREYLSRSVIPEAIYFDGSRCQRVPWEPMWGGGDGPF